MGQIILRYKGKEEKYEVEERKMRKIRSLLLREKSPLDKLKKFKGTWKVQEENEDDYYLI